MPVMMWSRVSLSTPALQNDMVFDSIFTKEKSPMQLYQGLNKMPATGIEPVRASLPTGF